MLADVFHVVLSQPCGVDYELKAFVADTPEDKPHKRWEKL